MFITFEGIDSSGKTTQLQMLAHWFGEQGLPYLVVREPGGTTISERIRDLLLDPMHDEMHQVAELFLFSAARAQLTREIIIPSLKNGLTVLCDRYFDSTTVYQGNGRGIDLLAIHKINSLATAATTPDVTFYIDISYDESQRRKHAAQADTDRMERASQDFFKKVRDGYLALAKEESERFIIIDGLQERNAIHAAIVQEIALRMKEK